MSSPTVGVLDEKPEMRKALRRLLISRGIQVVEYEFDFRPPTGKIFIEEYSKFIPSRNALLGSAGQLSEVRTALKP